MKTFRFDEAEWLETREDIEYFIADALETGNPSYIVDCLGVVARSKGMTKLSNESGIAREQLYNSSGAGGNPTLRTFFALINALNVKLTVRHA
ncbi:MAG: putative addiction module antidote protein [Azoarcus sp.]|jgi:probable addiction module antidote protein|nr:putative addiction module antidote protein [Azoarcus sp.]